MTRLTKALHEQAVDFAYKRGLQAGKAEADAQARASLNEQRSRALTQLISVVGQTLGEQAKIVESLARVLDNGGVK